MTIQCLGMCRGRDHPRYAVCREDGRLFITRNGVELDIPKEFRHPAHVRLCTAIVRALALER